MIDRAGANHTFTGRGLVIPPTGAHPLAAPFARYVLVTREAWDALGEVLSPTERAFFQQAYAALTQAFARDAKSTAKVFASPTVATPLHCRTLRDALPDLRSRIDASLADVAPHVVLELGARGLLPEEFAVVLDRAVVLDSPTLSVRIRPPPRTAAVRFTATHLTALAAERTLGQVSYAGDASTGFDIEPVYHRIGGVSRFALVDHNPISAFEAHPDKSGNHVDLGGHSLSAWRSALDGAFAPIRAHCPEIFSEMGFLLREVIPVGFDREKHLSASYREAIGSAYLTLHPHVMTMAEALVHEFQHNKLNLVSFSAELLENPYHPKYPSPVRPDPRPLWGILLAVHAFLPVAVLYRRMRAAGDPLASSPDFARRLREIDAKNHEGIAMLRAHARWTREGRAMMDELEALDATHIAESTEPSMAAQAHDD